MKRAFVLLLFQQNIYITVQEKFYISFCRANKERSNNKAKAQKLHDS